MPTSLPINAPQHQFNARCAKQQQENIQFQTNLHENLIYTPDPESAIPFETPCSANIQMKQIHQTNH